MYYIGLISGTSIDSVDAALVDFRQHPPVLLAYRQVPFPRDLSERLKSLDPTSPIELVSECDGRLGDVFADAAIGIAGQGGIDLADVAAIGSHGQTVLHAPRATPPNSWQIGDPGRIAWRTGVPTVADFRRLDMAAGGEGAPLAPAFHAFRFRVAGRDRAVVNIGGIANLSMLPGEPAQPVTGFDTGPGNGLLDAWIREHRGLEMDRDGEWAAGGRVIEPLLGAMLADPYFAAAPPKSTGKEYFNVSWLRRHLDRCPAPGADPRDVQATLLELSARSITDAIGAHAPGAVEVLVCGGGVHNPALMQRLRELAPGRRVESTAAHGLDPDAVEAVLIAWLARQRLERKPGNLPSVTGAKQPLVLGALYEPKRQSQVTSHKS